MPPNKPNSAALRHGRFSAAGAAYFVTSNVQDRRPLLIPAAREIVIDSLLWARSQKHIWLLGYVILDDHFHTLVVLCEGMTLPIFMAGLKRHTARQTNKIRGQAGQFWQEGYHDHVIRDEPDLWRHVRYMHENPVRRGLVTKPEDYIWSTAHAGRQRDTDWDKVGYSGV
jgi:putative transposase